jgi:hypothetical protein
MNFYSGYLPLLLIIKYMNKRGNKTMAEYIAGRGTTALGIVGTVLGSLGTANALGGAGLPLVGKAGAPYFEASCACMNDIKNTKELMDKDARIAKLESERYTVETELQLYKYFDGELKDIRHTIEVNKDNANARFAEQAVYNATVNGTLGTVTGQIAALQTIVNSITKAVVPSNVVCAVNNCCNTCTSGNI